MNVNTDPVLARIEQAERMLQTAKDQHRKGFGEEVAEFLASAGRHIGKAQEAVKQTATVSALPRGKEAAHAR